MNFKTILLTIFINLYPGILSSSAQTYSPMISDEEIYTFLNWEVKHSPRYLEEPFWARRKRIKITPSEWNIESFVLADSLKQDSSPLYRYSPFYFYHPRNQIDTLFSDTDTAYIHNQVRTMLNTTWQKSPGNSVLLKRRQLRKNVYYYSIPIFSADHQIVMVKKSYYCGSLCAHGGIYVYKKIGTRSWEFIRIVNGWIS